MILAIVGVVLALAIGVLVWWFRREQHRRLPAVSTPPIVFVPHHERGSHWLATHGDGEPQPAALAAAKPQLVEAEEEVPVRRVAGLADTPPAPRRSPRAAPAGAAAVTPGSRAAASAAAPPAPPAVGAAFAPVAPATPADRPDAHGSPLPEAWSGRAAPMPVATPPAMPSAMPASGPAAAAPIIAGSTLRMLPGRLEYVDADGAAADIRFVHCSAGPEQRVTLGRGEGPSYEHVQLRSPTVSRMHAAMVYRDGRWTIANLSETNPLRLNGLELASDSTAVPLSDGDLIELGEVVLRFRG